MPPDVNPPIGSVRAAKAAATRARIVRAAYELFCEQGYASTTMTEIAVRADVAVQTLYFTFQTKAAILQEAFFAAVVGEDKKPPPEQPWWQNMVRASDVRRALGYAVDGAVEIFGRVVPLVVALRAIDDPEVAAMRQRQDTMRHAGYRDVLAVVAAKEPLRAGVSVDEAADVMFVLLSPEVFRTYTVDRGWSARRYRRWVTDALHRLLFARA